MFLKKKKRFDPNELSSVFKRCMERHKVTSVLLSKSKSDSLHPTKRYTHTLPLFQLSITTSFLFLFSFTLNYNSEMLAFYKLGVKMYLILEGIIFPLYQHMRTEHWPFLIPRFKLSFTEDHKLNKMLRA